MLSSGAVSMAAPVTHLDAHRLNWSFLVLEGGKGPISVSADILLKQVPEGELVNDLLMPEEEGAPIAAGGDALLIDFHSQSMGKDLRTRLWFRSRDVAALQRGRLELTAKNERYKLYRYTRKGLFVVRRKPLAGEERKAPDSWSGVKRSFISYPEGTSGDIVLSDPSVLLYLVSVADFEQPGDEINLQAYADEKLVVVTVRYEGDEEISADFEAEGVEGKRRIKGKRSALRLGVTSRPLEGGRGGSGLKIAGLGGDIKILVDRELRLPLELRGKVRMAGNVSLRATRVKLTKEN